MTNRSQYPLNDNAPDSVQAASERPLADITMDSLGTLSSDDIRIHGDTLRQQAAFAQAAGYDQLAQNLLRAAELTVVANEEIIRIYDLLRPERATLEQLHTLADYLEQQYGAVRNAAFIREAAAVYHERGLLKRLV